MKEVNEEKHPRYLFFGNKLEKNCYETVKILENIENWDVKVKRFATFN